MHQDTTYPDPDLITAYIARKGVKTFHTEALEFDPEPELGERGGGWYELPDGSTVQGKATAHDAAVHSSIAGTGKTNCGEHEVTDLTEMGWARQARRRGLEEHAACRKAREEWLTALLEAATAADDDEADTGEASS